MADKKISQLTAATTPLAGTEVLPIVQGGSTVKVSIDNVTKGRTVNATTFDTDVASAGVTLTGVTLSADGTDANIDINVTPKGTGSVNIAKANIDGGTVDGTTIGGASAAAGTFTTATATRLTASGDYAANGGDLTLTNTNGGRSWRVGDGIAGVVGSLVLFNSTGGTISSEWDGSGNYKINNGNFVFGTAGKGIQDGSSVDRVSIAAAATVVNESGADLDFRVEGDTDVNTLFVDASTDRVGVGTNTPSQKLDVRGAAYVQTNSNPTDSIVITATNQTTVANNGAKLAFDAYNIGSAGIGVPSNDGALVFYANTYNTERMRITSAGNIVAGASAALATTATDGFLYVPTCAGTPTGTPTAITGMAPIVVDTTNNKMYFYSGGQWRDAGP